MSKVCGVCTHPKRSQIDRAWVEGRSLRDIEGQYGPSKTALDRHKKDHLPAKLVKAEEVKEVIQADSLLARLTALNKETQAILKDARESKNNELALKAIARVEKQLELEGRLLGELNDQTTVNILVAPEWLAVRAAIMEALSEYPDARRAVAARLLGLGSDA